VSADQDKEGGSAFMSRGVLLAFPGFAVTIAVCAILGSLGWWIAAMLVGIVGGLGFVPFIVRSILLALGGLVICATAGIFASSVEGPLFGETVRGIPVAQAAAYRGAAIFHFSDGRVLADREWSLPVYGESKGVAEHELYRLRIAPIVGEGWTPDQPITAWAVTSAPNSGMPRGDWSRPSRAGLRATTSSDADIRAAIASAGRIYGLNTVPDAVLLHWLDDPEAAVAGQYWRLFNIFLVCAVLWAILLLVDAVLAKNRRSATAFRSD